MGKTMKKTGKKSSKRTKHSSMDLRNRASIIVETADIENMSHAELMQRINMLNAEILKYRRENDDLSFMIVEPKIRAMKRMRSVLKERLGIIH